MDTAAPDLSPDDIRELRRQLGLTVAAAARQVGVTRQAWHRWEAGTRSPTSAARASLRKMTRRIRHVPLDAV